MRLILLLCLASFCIASETVVAQNAWEAEPISSMDSMLKQIAIKGWRKKVFIADDLLAGGDPITAIKVYEMALKERPKDRYTLYKIGEANYSIRHYPNAQKWYEQLLAVDTVKYPFARYYLAKSLKYQGFYEKAILEFNHFHVSNPKLKKSADKLKIEDLKSRIATEVEGCKLGLQYALETTKRIEMLNIGAGINHPLTDLSPRLVNDSTLLYAALLPDSAFIVQDTTDTRFTRMITAQKVADVWQNQQMFDFRYNNGTYHVGNGIYSPDGKRFYFTRCSEVKGGIRCQIYESMMTDTLWSEPVALNESVNGEFSSTHPVVVTNEKGEEILFYASNRPGGTGGFDIWQVTRDAGGNFTNIQNPGTIINTYYDEMTPYFDVKNQTLYFSSEGRINIGGHDIYSSKKDAQGNWGEPQNMGIPVNSSVDDLYFAQGENKNKGFLVSNRPGGLSPKSPTCCDDIWSFKFPPNIVFVEGWVTDDSTGERIREGMVEFYDAETDSLVASAPITADGYYKVKLKGDKNYRVVATSPEYFDAETTVNTMNREEGETMKQDIAMEKRPYHVGLKMGIVYYDFDKSKLRDDSRPVLDNIVATLKNYSAIIETGGHTDDMGDVPYNMKLSVRRAEAVYNYLVRQGVPKEQLTQKGYGETVPVAPNKHPDGKDNPQGRQMNRRAEFTVVGEYKPVKQ